MSNRKKLTEHGKQIPSLDYKGVDGKRIYIYRQRSKPFRESTKRKKDRDSGPLVNEGTMGGIEYDAKEQKIQQDFLWALGPGTTRKAPRSKYRSELDKIKIDKVFKLYTSYYLPKMNKYISRGDSFWAKQTDTETPEGDWEKLIKLAKNAFFQIFGPSYLYQKF